MRIDVLINCIFLQSNPNIFWSSRSSFIHYSLEMQLHVIAELWKSSDVWLKTHFRTSMPLWPKHQVLKYVPVSAPQEIFQTGSCALPFCFKLPCLLATCCRSVIYFAKDILKTVSSITHNLSSLLLTIDTKKSGLKEKKKKENKKNKKVLMFLVLKIMLSPVISYVTSSWLNIFRGWGVLGLKSL